MAELMWELLLVIFTVTIILADDQPACGQTQPMPTKFKVRDKLLCAYDKNVRPVVNPADSIRVQIFLAAIFLDIDESRGQTIMHAWTSARWNDSYLTWNINANDNVGYLEVDSSQIWTPRISVSNFGSLASRSNLLGGNGLCSVFSSGEVFCSWRTVYYASCSLDYTNWPFDTQLCQIEIVYESFKAEEVNITHATLDVVTSYYEPSKTWDLIDTSQDTVITKSYYNTTIPRLIYNFTLKRHSAVFVAVLAVPALCAIVMTLMPYLMQPNRPQRILLAAAGLAVNVFLLKGIGEHMWHYSSTVPRIVCFYRDSTYIAVSSLIVSLWGRLLLISTLQPPAWLTSGSQSVLDVWNNYSVFVRVQKPIESPEAVSPSKDFWTRFMTIVDGTGLAVSCLMYIIFIVQSLLP